MLSSENKLLVKLRTHCRVHGRPKFDAEMLRCIDTHRHHLSVAGWEVGPFDVDLALAACSPGSRQ